MFKLTYIFGIFMSLKNIKDMSKAKVNLQTEIHHHHAYRLWSPKLLLEIYLPEGFNHTRNHPTIQSLP